MGEGLGYDRFGAQGGDWGALVAAQLGSDPLTGKNRIDSHSRSAAFDGGSRVALPGQDEAYAEYARQGFPPEKRKAKPCRRGGSWPSRIAVWATGLCRL